MDEMDVIVGGYKAAADDAVTELEKCLAEHRAYSTGRTLQRVKLAAEYAVASICQWQAKRRAVEEIRTMRPENRLRMPQATA